MNYWLDLFTGTTWTEFQESGSTITGFRKSRTKIAAKLQPCDILLCYVTGVKRWVGALEVVRVSEDQSKIWSDEDFPIRFEVIALIQVSPEHGIPMEELEGKVAFFTGPEDRGKFKAFVRSDLNRFSNPQDAKYIISLLKEAESNPVDRPVDPKKLARRPA